MIESWNRTKKEQSKIIKVKKRNIIAKKDIGLPTKRTYLITIRQRNEGMIKRKKNGSSAKL